MQDEIYVSMEHLFLLTLNDLDGNLSYLMTDKHASHVLRVLLVVLSGQPLANTSTTSLLQSRKKEKVRVAGIGEKARLVESGESGIAAGGRKGDSAKVIGQGLPVGG